MARPKKTLTEKQIIQLEALAAFLTVEQIAEYFGISDDTLSRRMAGDTAVMRVYKKGKTKAIAGVAQKLLSKAKKGDNACMFFYLKTQAGFRETSHFEHTGANGQPLAPPTVVFERAGKTD